MRLHASFRLTRFFATPRARLVPRRDAGIFLRFPLLFSSSYPTWELSKRAQRAVRVVNNRDRINWNSFQHSASNLIQERKFRHPSRLLFLSSCPSPPWTDLERIFEFSPSQDRECANFGVKIWELFGCFFLNS